MTERVHTYVICPKCKEGVRPSRHSDDDCVTIHRLKAAEKPSDAQIEAEIARLTDPRRHMDFDAGFRIGAKFGREGR